MLVLPARAACLAAASAFAGPFDELPVVVVDRDNVTISESCRIHVAAPWIEDTDGNGVIHVGGSGITVDFGGERLAGASPDRPIDQLTGVGITITGARNTLRNALLAGFHTAILARDADGLVIEDVKVESNFGQRLRSTPQAEDGADWLWPHENDRGEWRERYGAAVCIESSTDVTVRRVSVRRSQNGIMLVRVNGSRLYDNDCSFLSGWGLSMWRSSSNIVSRNAFDFCVRGYSHGVYNRGQDSAGILLFEQCCSNVFAENSVTHGGDGVFGFAGREALGENPPAPDTPASWYARRGCNDNVFLNNDLSDAVAHGLEMTFSFGNRVEANQISRNGICGVWGGYSQEMVIVGNHLSANGDMAYGLERGGINIEHGADNLVVGNVIDRSPCGVHLWSDPDEALSRSPWVAANGRRSRDNVIARNRFIENAIGIELRDADKTFIAGNVFRDVKDEIVADEGSRAAIDPNPSIDQAKLVHPDITVLGDSRPVGARKALRGRANILMTPHGPYDHEGPMLHRVSGGMAAESWRLLGDVRPKSSAVIGAGPLRLWANSEGTGFVVYTTGPDMVCSYELRIALTPEERLSGHGVVAWLDWNVRLFPWTVDPREDVDAWRAQSNGENAVAFRLRSLDLDFGGGTPADAVRRLARTEALHPAAPPRSLDQAAQDLATLPGDRFGTIASCTATFRPGRYRLSVVSDDGVRVRVGDSTVIDNWTWHAPTEDTAILTFAEETTVPILVEHFELDGIARLALRLETAPDVTTGSKEG